jgi:hypothetical protein
LDNNFLLGGIRACGKSASMSFTFAERFDDFFAPALQMASSSCSA